MVVMGRWLTWVADQQFRGWACSYCEWNSPVPSLLTDPEAKSAYDRLAASKFEQHDCSHFSMRNSNADDSFAEKARRLILRGLKPKDAVDITLQEISLEHRNDDARLRQAHADAEDFLRRIKNGSI
jgi:hypothetical protein